MGTFGKFLVAVAAIYWVSAGAAWAVSLEVVTPGHTAKLTLEQMRGRLKIYTIKIDDPVYKSAKAFDAFLLTDILAMAHVKGQANFDEIVFTAKDGYSPNTLFDNLAKHKAYLAYQEHGTKGHFGKVAQGKTMVSPAPFYLVWEGGVSLEHEVPWPYQLVKIEVVELAKKYANAFPKNLSTASSEYKGFMLFKAECIRCHSVNLQGGDVGPELNVPKNITEYWKDDVLKSFIQKPSGFRLKSKMPDFANLSAEAIGDIVSYLSYMKGHKSVF
jgi:mono/diheme cytochrome c family protein